MTDQNPNISQFAKTIGKDPSYLSKLCKKLDIEGSVDPRHPRSRLLSIEDQDKIRDYLGIPSRTVPDTIPIEIITECSIVQDAPVLPDRVSLSQFRGDRAQAVTIADPLTLVRDVTGMVDGLIAAMRSDTATRQSELSATIAATQQLQGKAAELRDEALLYKIRTEITTSQQGAAVQALNAEVGKLQALGAGDG